MSQIKHTKEVEITLHAPAILKEHEITLHPEVGFVGGDGTAEDPLRIANWYGLNRLRDFVGQEYSDKHFILVDDINHSSPGYHAVASPEANEGKGWEPVGSFEERFGGYFHGNKKHIMGLYINRKDLEHPASVGMFDEVGHGAVFEDFALAQMDVTGPDKGPADPGVEYTLEVGGLIGVARDCTIRRVSVHGRVEGNEDVGGMIGRVWHTDFWIEDCSAFVDVVGEYTDIAGIGGMIGRLGQGGEGKRIYSVGEVVGEGNVGGIIGQRWAGEHIKDSVWDRQTSDRERSSAGGTALSTGLMKDIETYEQRDWDIARVEDWNGETWHIFNGLSYPMLGEPGDVPDDLPETTLTVTCDEDMTDSTTEEIEPTRV